MSEILWIADVEADVDLGLVEREERVRRRGKGLMGLGLFAG